MRLLVVVLLAFSFGCSSFQGVGRLSSPDYSAPGGGSRKAAGPFKMDWPVDKARLTQKFKTRARRPHWGIDLANKQGSGIFAAHDGTVVYAGAGFRGYGRLVIIEYGERWATFYGHLDQVFVREGERVHVGDRIASMGQTGRASGPHLHFELRKDRKPVDPLIYLP